MAPHPLPPSGNESRVTAGIKVAVSLGKPKVFSVPNRTASRGFSIAQSIGCSLPMPHQGLISTQIDITKWG
jgi:hypothetical protein